VREIERERYYERERDAGPLLIQPAQFSAFATAPQPVLFCVFLYCVCNIRVNPRVRVNPCIGLTPYLFISYNSHGGRRRTWSPHTAKRPQPSALTNASQQVLFCLTLFFMYYSLFHTTQVRINPLNLPLSQTLLNRCSIFAMYCLFIDGSYRKSTQVHTQRGRPPPDLVPTLRVE